MEAKEFIIKKFEKNNPEILKIIDEWTEHSINQNWDELKIIFNQTNVPNCPPDVFDDKLQANKRYYFFKNLLDKVSEYLLAKGYKRITICYTKTLISPDGRYFNGYYISAGFTNSNKNK